MFHPMLIHRITLHTQPVVRASVREQPVPAVEVQTQPTTRETQTATTGTTPSGFMFVGDKGKQIIKPITQDMIHELTQKKVIKHSRVLPANRYQRKPYYVRGS